MKQLYLCVSALVLESQKLPNRVRWPGGGIPYTFQNIPLCPGVVHESSEKSGEKSGEKSVEKSMMYITYAINNASNSMQLKQ